MRATRAFILVAFAAHAAGCILTSEDPPPPVYLPSLGTLTVAYTIEGTTDPAICSVYGVSDAELVVSTRSGGYVAKVYAPCSSFEVRTNVEPGLYRADITLVDEANRARSITKPLEDVRVLSDTEVVVDVDFPRGSML